MQVKRKCIISVSSFVLMSCIGSPSWASEGVYAGTIYGAVEKNDMAALTKLIDANHDVNQRGNFYSTALHRASKQGNLQAATVLLENGADVNLQDLGGESALHQAAEAGNQDIVKLLMQYGADVNLRNGEGKTALYYAVRKKRNDVVRGLVSLGADIELPSFSGEKPLELAIRQLDGPMVKILLDNDADTMYRMADGRTLEEYGVAVGGSVSQVVQAFMDERERALEAAIAQEASNNEQAAQHADPYVESRVAEAAVQQKLKAIEAQALVTQKQLQSARVEAEAKAAEAMLRIEQVRAELEKARARRELLEIARQKRLEAEEERRLAQAKARAEALARKEELERNQRIEEARALLAQERARQDQALEQAKELLPVEETMSDEAKSVIDDLSHKQLQSKQELATLQVQLSVLTSELATEKAKREKAEQHMYDLSRLAAKELLETKNQWHAEVSDLITSRDLAKAEALEAKSQLSDVKAELLAMEQRFSALQTHVASLQQGGAKAVGQAGDLPKLDQLSPESSIAAVSIENDAVSVLSSSEVGEATQQQESVSDDDIEIARLLEAEFAPTTDTAHKPSIPSRKQLSAVQRAERLAKIERQVKALEDAKWQKEQLERADAILSEVHEPHIAAKTAAPSIAQSDIAGGQGDNVQPASDILEVEWDEAEIEAQREDALERLQQAEQEKQSAAPVEEYHSDDTLAKLLVGDEQIADTSLNVQGADQLASLSPAAQKAMDNARKTARGATNLEAIRKHRETLRKQIEQRKNAMMDSSAPRENVSAIASPENSDVPIVPVITDNVLAENEVKQRGFERLRGLKERIEAMKAKASSGETSDLGGTEDGVEVTPRRTVDLLHEELVEVASVSDDVETRDAPEAKVGFLGHLEEKLTAQGQEGRDEAIENALVDPSIMPWNEQAQQQNADAERYLNDGAMKISKVQPVEDVLDVAAQAEGNREKLKKIARILATLKKKDSQHPDKVMAENVQKPTDIIANAPHVEVAEPALPDAAEVALPNELPDMGDGEFVEAQQLDELSPASGGDAVRSNESDSHFGFTHSIENQGYWLKIGDFVDGRTAYQHYKNVRDAHLLRGLKYRPLYSSQGGYESVSFKVGPLKSLGEVSRMCMKFRANELGCSTISPKTDANKTALK